MASEFGKGFSYSNLCNFRQFYLTYPDKEKCYALRSKLSWTHHRLIMRVENSKVREYYLHETEEQNWSSRVLERNINTSYYQRLLSSQDTKQALQHSKTLEKQATSDFIKDSYIFEFLNIPQPI